MICKRSFGFFSVLCAKIEYMKKRILIAVLAILAMLTLTGMYFYYDATAIAPDDYRVSYVKVESAKLDKSFPKTSILYLTDLEYGGYVGEQQLDKLQKLINTLDYDVILFGGDLFDLDYNVVSDDIQILTEFLRSLKAPRGKFAIFGDFDLQTESRKNVVNKVLSDSNFEILNNQLTLYLNYSQSVSLYGYSYSDQLKENIDTESLSLALIHNLELVNQLSDADLILCGNSHHKQINWPFSSEIRPGQHGNLYYSGGVGLTGEYKRLFNDPEVVIIQLIPKE